VERIHIHLPKKDLALLRRIAKKRGESVASVVRDGVRVLIYAKYRGEA